MHKKQNLADTRTAISDGETYPLDNFMSAVGWGRHAMRNARRQGLRVVRVSGRCFVRGKDFSEFLGTLAADSEVAQ